MRHRFNVSQKKALSGFFNNIAVAWFTGAFISPVIAEGFNWLTLLRYLGNMIGALLLALYFLEEET